MSRLHFLNFWIDTLHHISNLLTKLGSRDWRYAFSVRVCLASRNVVGVICRRSEIDNVEAIVNVQLPEYF